MLYLLSVTYTTKVLCCLFITNIAFTVLMINGGTHYMEIHPLGLSILITDIKLLLVNVTLYIFHYLCAFSH